MLLAVTNHELDEKKKETFDDLHESILVSRPNLSPQYASDQNLLGVR